MKRHIQKSKYRKIYLDKHKMKDKKNANFGMINKSIEIKDLVKYWLRLIPKYIICTSSISLALYIKHSVEQSF